MNTAYRHRITLTLVTATAAVVVALLPAPFGRGTERAAVTKQAEASTRQGANETRQGADETRRDECVSPRGPDPRLGTANPAVQAIMPKGPEERSPVLLCQALGPAAPHPICGVDCYGNGCPGTCRARGWEASRLIQWQQFAQGEYCGQPRTAHVPEYRLRVADEIDLVYRLTREETAKPYQLEVGDEIRVESFTDPELTRELLIQPDGTITLRLLGQVHANGKTVAQLTEDLEQAYRKYYKVPAITVTPLKVNTRLEDLRESVDARYGQGGLQRIARVTPEGTIGLPVLGSVFVQGLTLGELRQELNERYNEQIPGIEVTPVLVQRAPRYVYVLGEVAQPGRYELTGPTTLLQALSMAGSWNVGARIDHIVVFRRGDDWRLLATKVDLQAALYGNAPCPPGEIWIADSDVIIVPKSPILRATDFIELVFTRGIYGVFPVNTSINFAKASTI
jgi:polysaccharide export outer membrane protein